MWYDGESIESAGWEGHIGYAWSEDVDATVKVVVWNARGPQNAPGAIVEEKEVLIRQIKEDIAANRPTESPPPEACNRLSWARRAPAGNCGYHHG